MSKRPDYGDATPEDLALALLQPRNGRPRKGRSKRSSRHTSKSGDKTKTEKGFTEEPTRQS